MKEVLVDTDILSYFFKGEPNVVPRFSQYLQKYPSVSISIITYYEISSGLQFRKAEKQLKSFHMFLKYANVLPVTESSAEISARLYSQTRKSGNAVDDIDLLIAGIALENKLAMATNNEKHFGKSSRLKLKTG